LNSLISGQTFQENFAGHMINISHYNYRKIPLLLSFAVHLGVILFSIVAPLIMYDPSLNIPEVYTVNLYNVPEVAPPPPSVAKIVQISTPTPKKAIAQKHVKRDAVSLSPIRKRLLKEKKDKEARKRLNERKKREINQVKMELLQEQAENEVRQAEKVLLEAKKEAAAKIAELYKRSVESIASQQVVEESSVINSRNGDIDRQKLEALDRYRARLFDHIAPHWQLPELQDWDESLRAVIIMQVNRDGSVTNVYFEKRSGNQRFNQYARKTIDNAQPLPPFPIDFHDKSEEIAVTFSPGGLF